MVVVLVDDFREAGDDFVLHRDGAGLQDLQDLVDEAFSGNGSAEPPELGQNELRQTSSGVDDGDVVVFERHKETFSKIKLQPKYEKPKKCHLPTYLTQLKMKFAASPRYLRRKRLHHFSHFNFVSSIINFLSHIFIFFH